MTQSKRSPRGGAASQDLLQRPLPSHRGLEAQTVRTEQHGRLTDADPHPSWLKTWRRLHAELGGNGRAGLSRDALHELQDNIANTPAETLAGLQAQAELIAELAWNDLVAKAARQLISGLKRVQRSDDR